MDYFCPRWHGKVKIKNANIMSVGTWEVVRPWLKHLKLSDTGLNLNENEHSLTCMICTEASKIDARILKKNPFV